MELLKNIIISKLFEMNAIIQGDFTLKSGLKSNLYFDLRLLISHPSIYKYILELAELKYPDLFNNINIVTGIEFGGLPFSNYVSFNKNIPQIFIRSSIKNYGTKKAYEGNYQVHDKILLIDDVLTTGESIKTTIDKIESNNLNLSKILVILDRSENKQTIFNYDYYPILTLDDINNYPVNKKFYENAIADKIYNIALSKKSNIILSCDLDNWKDILKLIKNIGEHIIGIKFHIEIIKDFNKQVIQDILDIKTKYNLIIIEDRKLCDIGMISIKELSGFFEIAHWADCITVHSMCGLDLFKNLNDIYPNLGLLPVCEMSLKNSLFDDGYIKKSINILRTEYNIAGGIVQHNVMNIIKPFERLTLSPGINLTNTKDNYDQSYNNPNNLTKKTGLIWIIGRGIYENDNILEYKKLGWKHFINY